MLSSVGATKKQKRDSVFFEGAVISLISIAIAIVVSAGGSIASVRNVFMDRQRDRQTIVLMSVFAYRFIALITAICVANILIRG